MDVISAGAFRLIVALCAVVIAASSLFAVIVFNDIKLAEQQQNVSLQEIRRATNDQTSVLKKGIDGVSGQLVWLAD